MGQKCEIPREGELWVKCGCETHKAITCCNHHQRSCHGSEGYVDCHPFGATCEPGCDECRECISPLESYKKELGIEYENKWGYKKVDKYDFVRHEVKVRERFWKRKSEGQESSEWNGETWELMKGYYACLFCKKINFTTKEKH